MAKFRYILVVKFISFLVLILQVKVEGKVVDFKKVEDLETKLNLILDSEMVEKNILENMVTKNEVHGHEVKRSSALGKNAESAEILNDLVETSGRMEWLVGVLADLKNMLKQTIESQRKELSLQAEAGELREEINYLREEVQVLKQNQIKSETFQLNSKVHTKLENQEKKMEWLTTGLEEIRHELREVSSTFNVTTLFQLSEEAQNDAKATRRNMDTFQKDLEKMEVVQAKTTQDIVEIRGDMADLGKREADLGVTLTKSRSQTSLVELHSKLKRFRSIPRGRRQDKKKLRSELTVLGTTMDGLLFWTAELEKKVDDLEKQKTTQVPTEFMVQEQNALDDTDYTRLMTLETSVSETQNHLRELKAEVSGFAELKDSAQTLFKVLEALETKYDSHMTEFQEKLSHIDAVTSVLSTTQDEVKEQQTMQWKASRKWKLQFQNTEKRLAETHLRLAALQTHILQWGMKTCSDEMKEKAQDLRIESLEKKLRQSRAEF